MAISDWNELREAALRGYDDAIICLADIEIMELSNRRDVVDALNRGRAHLTTQLVLDALSYRIHLLVTRAFAAARRKDDIHLRAAIDFLRQPGTIGQEAPERQDRLQAAVDQFDSLDKDPRVLSLKHMRDKSLAHLARPDPAIPIPLYRDLFAVARETSSVWEHLANGTGVVMVDLVAQLAAHRLSALAFWSPWTER